MKRIEFIKTMFAAPFAFIGGFLGCGKVRSFHIGGIVYPSKAELNNIRGYLSTEWIPLNDCRRMTVINGGDVYVYEYDAAGKIKTQGGKHGEKTSSH